MKCGKCDNENVEKKVEKYPVTFRCTSNGKHLA